jgi:2-polyprenyl-3-methyl-5-hydroxy-6-metoxy-1,4-benzoquinol methylase
MLISELVLYHLAHLLARSEVAHSSEMKAALTDRAKCDRYRGAEAGRVVDAAARFGITLRDADILDLGCNDGALTSEYVRQQPRSIVGADVDEVAVTYARKHASAAVDYRVSSTTALPVADASIDLILCYDVFEHVSQPAPILAECRRVLRPGGRMLIGTWGGFHPFAPHLWSTMPVPWAHVLVSERTLLRACRRVYQSRWYKPTFHDFDADGTRKREKYLEDSISTEYLNKFLVRDFERVFRESGLRWTVHLQPFGSAPWTSPLLSLPILREFIHGYLWAVLEKPVGPR